MLESFEIKSSQGNYQIIFGRDLLTTAVKADSIILCDQRFADGLSTYQAPVIPVVANESSKDLDYVPSIIKQLKSANANRGSCLIAVGGGTIQDVAGFCASIYMRGLSWKYVPTTLLGMADSCIGGKSSINVGNYKNIAGTFHPPTEVLIDSQFLSTLNIEQKAAGLCEAAKICFARDTKTFAKYRELEPGLEMTSSQLEKAVHLSLSAKKWFIEIDEYDHAERLLLNFGHTFGHAIESASAFKIGHGIAVGLGMLIALELGSTLGRKSLQQSEVKYLHAHITHLLRAVPKLQELLETMSIEAALAAFTADKKHSSESFRVVLVVDGPQLKLINLPRTVATLATIRTAFSNLKLRWQ